MSSCRSSSGVSSKLLQQINRKIKVLETTLLAPYEGHVTHSCLVSPSGALIAQKRTPETDEVSSVLHGLYQSALQLAETLGDSEVPMLHIKGEQHIFSCFKVGSHLLALYVNMPRDKVELFDGFTTSDQTTYLVEELRLLVENSM